MTAMDASGGLGDSILNGIIPVLMVWKGRYVLGYSKDFRVPGGRLLLVGVAGFFVLALSIEIFGILGWIPSVYESYEIMEIHNVDQVISGS